MAGISANHPSSLLPLPQKYSFNGKLANAKIAVEERIVAQIDGAKFQEEASMNPTLGARSSKKARAKGRLSTVMWV